ncbi:hypothetical protein ACFORG_11060 [Lutimaribacter marinistellae]|uniref:Uncharacterized protein n=1 Tax=Lutimaribacter marinistellae TaxID=1820329 RepID=A0ABV7TG47_9RHOB
MTLRNIVTTLGSVLGIGLMAGCAISPTGFSDGDFKVVYVMERNWAVAQVAEDPAIWRATRDSNGYDPYGPPPRLRTVQGLAAIAQATGCRPVTSTAYRNISGQVFAQVAC